MHDAINFRKLVTDPTRYDDIAPVGGRILAGREGKQLLTVGRADAAVHVAAGDDLIHIAVVGVLVHVDVLVVDKRSVVDDIDGERPNAPNTSYLASP